MEYYFSKTVRTNWKETSEKVQKALKKYGFGILNETDIRHTLKEKINADIRPYKILGACHPTFAYQALQADPQIGTLLPCNIILREKEDGQIEVSAVDPVASMKAVENKTVGQIADRVRENLKSIIESL